MPHDPALKAAVEELLLEEADRLDEQRWRDWLEARGWGDARPRGILHFNQYDLVIQAALAGQGLALGRLGLIQPLIDEGRLVPLGPPKIDAENTHAYWLIRAEEQPRREVLGVAAWLLSEAGG